MSFQVSLQEKIARIIETCRSENPCEIEVRYNEPMAAHSTFKTGGPADCWLRPVGDGFPAFAAALLAAARAAKIPLFFLGGGANILIADAGIRGIVLDLNGWAGEEKRPQKNQNENRQNQTLCFRAGTNLDAAANTAAEAGLSGMEFLAGMPGSIGGAVWMNARCYGQEIADVLTETEIIDFSGTEPALINSAANRGEFGYKHSPFQSMDAMILSASFKLTAGNKDQTIAKMDSYRKDRESKGHYRFPSAGSVFKNNPDFGKPSGKIIDELGLCGLQIGGAQVAPWHGNIIINTDAASSADIRLLVNEVAARVNAATGFNLEPEILFIGEWN